MSEKKYAVIVAGGMGTRMGGNVPKQFLPLLGIPLMCYAVKAFADAIPDINIIVVLPAGQLGSAQTVLRTYLSNITVTTVAGGDTRYHSVKNGLKLVPDDGVVFIHDGARPLVSEELISRCYMQAVEKGSAIPVIPVTESMRKIDRDGSSPVNRDTLRAVQTPQAFLTHVILPAFALGFNPSFTDEATVVEAYGTPVFLIDGAAENIKVTRPEDIIIAEALLNTRNASAA